MFHKTMTVGLALIAGLMIGCGGKKTAEFKGDAVPDFILNPPRKAGTLYGSGSAKKASIQLSKETADLRAKKEIAKILSQKVSNMMKDFLSEAGEGDNAEVTELSQSITKTITDVELNGCVIEKREILDGTFHSLASYELNGEARNFIKNLVEKELTSKEALLSRFRAKQGFEELNSELEKFKQD